MSCYEEEYGEIIIPSKDWKKTREAIIGAANKEEENIFQTAIRAHGWIKRNRKRGETVRASADRCAAIIDLDCETAERIVRMLTSKSGNLQLPKQKDIAIRPLSKSTTIRTPHASIALRNKSRTIYYAVDENNHACEYARDEPVVRAMFSALYEVNFTRGSGGYIRKSDEYQDNGLEYYIEDHFGPIGEKAAARVAKAHMALAGF
jgi:hypothetical protein